MNRWLIALAVLGVAACSPKRPVPPVWIHTDTPGAELAFVRADAGWSLSLSPPRYPYGASIGPELEAVSQAGTSSVFGCGLTSLGGNYFTGRRGPLACVLGQADGRLRQTTVSTTPVSRVYDAATAQGRLQVIAQFVGSTGPTILTLTPDGIVVDSVTLDRRWRPDQAVILKTGRIALSQSNDGRCNWYVIERRREGFAVVSETPAEAVGQCHAYNSGGGILRDQVNNDLYAYFGHPNPNALYRIDDHGARSPLVLLTPNLAERAASGTGDASMLTAHDGTIYFNLTTAAGPVVGRYRATSSQTTFTNLTAASGRWQDADRFTGFVISPDTTEAPLLALMNLRTGETTLRQIDGRD